MPVVGNLRATGKGLPATAYFNELAACRSLGTSASQSLTPTDLFLSSVDPALIRYDGYLTFSFNLAQRANSDLPGLRGTRRRHIWWRSWPAHEAQGMARLEAESFSTNTPEGACPRCHGIGRIYEATEQSMVPNPKLKLRRPATNYQVAALPSTSRYSLNQLMLETAA
jgi:hypothetical protein